MTRLQKIGFEILVHLLTLVAHLPLSVLYVLSDFLAFVVAHIVRYRRRVVFGNISRAFPDKSPEEVRRIAKAYYRHLCDLIVEGLKLLHISDAELAARINVCGGEEVEAAAASGRPVIIFLGHYGNWEWVQQVTLHYSSPPISAEIYRPMHSLVFDELMKRVRSRWNTLLIPQQQAIRKLMRMYSDGEQFLVGFIADQRPNSSHLYNWTTFLNQDTAFAVGGEELGRHLGAHYFYLQVEKTARGHYRMTFCPLRPIKMDVPYPYTAEYLRRLEQTINHAPEFWLWSHNRWKYNREGKTIH